LKSRRILLIALPVLLGWFMAAAAIWAGWSASLEARHVDGIRLRAELLAMQLSACSEGVIAACGVDSLRLHELSENGLYDIDLIDSSQRALASGAGVERRFLVENDAECILAEREITGGGVLRVSLPVERIGTRNPLVWGVASGSVALGSLLPLILLGWLLRTERTRISHLVDVARAAERGARPPEAPPQLLGGLQETVRLARGLGAEVRHLRLRSRLEERRLQRFVESLAEGVLILDDQSRVLLCNRAAYGVLGFDERLGASAPRQARGRSVFNLCTRLEFLDDLREALRREGDSEFDLPAGSRTWRIRLSRAPLETGKWGYVATLFDVTASREAELLQARLVSDVSHEFKTPLTSIRGYAETLLDETDPDGEDQAFQRKSLGRIIAATRHLEEVVSDLLDLGHIRETNGKLRREELDLREILQQVVTSLEPQGGFRGGSLELDLPPAPAMLPGDRGRLLRAVLNLATNALKYGASTEPVVIGLERRDDSWIVSVRDRGPGIPPEAIPHLFERFYRVDHGRSRDAGGTGLGLAIVRDVARAHGGEAQVESELGSGATFSMVLPIPEDSALRRSQEPAIPE
jgi:two-component system phosphate regulon sensor histidine kinase PhoR